MKTVVEIPNDLGPALDFMAECDGQTPDEYIQERVILYLQDWLFHIKDPCGGITRSICGHHGGPNMVTSFSPEDQPPALVSPIQWCAVCLASMSE